MSFVSLFESDHGETVVLVTLEANEKNIEKLHVRRAKMFLEEGRVTTLIRTSGRPQEWHDANRKERRARNRVLARLIKKLPRGAVRLDDPQPQPVDLILPEGEEFK